LLDFAGISLIHSFARQLQLTVSRNIEGFVRTAFLMREPRKLSYLNRTPNCGTSNRALFVIVMGSHRSLFPLQSTFSAHGVFINAHHF
jgi:hypothetical protein